MCCTSFFSPTNIPMQRIISVFSKTSGFKVQFSNAEEHVITFEKIRTHFCKITNSFYFFLSFFFLPPPHPHTTTAIAMCGGGRPAGCRERWLRARVAGRGQPAEELGRSAVLGAGKQRSRHGVEARPTPGVLVRSLQDGAAATHQVVGVRCGYDSAMNGRHRWLR